MHIDVRKPTSEEIALAALWPMWERDVADFAWSYDTVEKCLILEGAAHVDIDGGESVHFQAGDWVVFPTGLSCIWHITQKIKKRYHFGE